MYINNSIHFFYRALYLCFFVYIALIIFFYLTLINTFFYIYKLNNQCKLGHNLKEKIFFNQFLL